MLQPILLNTHEKINSKKKRINTNPTDISPLTVRLIRYEVARLKEQCHEDFAVLGQLCAKIINLRL